MTRGLPRTRLAPANTVREVVVHDWLRHRPPRRKAAGVFFARSQAPVSKKIRRPPYKSTFLYGGPFRRCAQVAARARLRR